MELWRAIRQLASFRVLVVATPVIAMLIPVMSAFSFLKDAIRDIKPFSFDPWVTTLDRALHVGYDPWVLLQPVLGHLQIIYMFSSIYTTRYSVPHGIVFWAAF